MQQYTPNILDSFMSDMGTKPMELGEGVTLLVGNMFKRLQEMTDTIESIISPSGKEKAPAKTCKDILMSHQHSQDGNTLLQYTFASTYYIKKRVYLRNECLFSGFMGNES